MQLERFHVQVALIENPHDLRQLGLASGKLDRHTATAGPAHPLEA
jgi:hypothetical protein